MFIVAPGFDGQGEWLAKALAPRLSPRGTILTYNAPRYGFEMLETVRLLARQINQFGYSTQIIADGEAIGGVVLAELLRVHPDINFTGMVLNAAPSCNRDVRYWRGSLTIAISPLLGPVGTALIRWQQKRKIRMGPPIAASADRGTALMATAASYKVTASGLYAHWLELRRFKPLRAGEFVGRVRNVRYLRAPGDGDLVLNASAAISWRGAFAPGTFEILTVSSWQPNWHFVTARDPKAVAEGMLALVP